MGTVARAGMQTRFWWGDDRDPAFGNFGDEKCCRGAALGSDVFEAIAPVRSFEPTPEGFHDLYGNVWEWVQDCYGDYNHAPRDGSANDPADCRVRVLRGGSYFFSLGVCPGERALSANAWRSEARRWIPHRCGSGCAMRISWSNRDIYTVLGLLIAYAAAVAA